MSTCELSVNLGHHSGKFNRENQWEKTEVLLLYPSSGDVFTSVCVWVGGIAKEEKGEQKERVDKQGKRNLTEEELFLTLSLDDPSHQ